MTIIDIHFSKLPTAEQLINKATGMAKRSKVALTSIVLSHRNDVMELTKDRQTKQWRGSGQVAGVKADTIIAALNAL